MALKQVVLPAPFGPIRPKISPLRRLKLTSLSATTPPKRSVTLSTSSRTSLSCQAERFSSSLPVGMARSMGRALAASSSCGVSMCGSLNGSHLLLAVLELHRATPARDQALRAEDHDHDDHRTED